MGDNRVQDRGKELPLHVVLSGGAIIIEDTSQEEEGFRRVEYLVCPLHYPSKYGEPAWQN